MAYTIRDFNFVAGQDETLNQTLIDLVNTLNDVKTAIKDIDTRLESVEEE